MENTTSGEAPVVQFNAAALAPVAVFKAETDVRYYLNGICVQPAPGGAGCFVIGCDGSRLAIWHDPDGKCSRLTVLRVDKALIAAARKKYKAQKVGTISLEGHRLVLKSTHGLELFVQAGKAEIEMARPGLQYPDVFRVIPAAKNWVPGMMGAFNPRYIEDLGKVGRMLDPKGVNSAVYHFHDKTAVGFGACITRFDHAQNFMVLTMTKRAEKDITSAPLPDMINRAKSGEPGAAPATVLHPMGSMGEEV